MDGDPDAATLLDGAGGANQVDDVTPPVTGSRLIRAGEETLGTKGRW